MDVVSTTKQGKQEKKSKRFRRTNIVKGGREPAGDPLTQTTENEIDVCRKIVGDYFFLLPTLPQFDTRPARKRSWHEKC